MPYSSTLVAVLDCMSALGPVDPHGLHMYIETIHPCTVLEVSACMVDLQRVGCIEPTTVQNVGLEWALTNAGNLLRLALCHPHTASAQYAAALHAA